MKRKDLYDKTVDILVQAYFNDTLEHGNYCGCAVGNLVGAAMKYETEKTNYNGIEFLDGGIDIGRHWFGYIKPENLDDCDSRIALQQINATGYSVDEIILIEKAFESVECIPDEDEYMFNGLMAVIEVLDQIHENTDTVLTETSKKRFLKTA